MDCVVRGGEVDAISKPHCQNCHGAPNTQHYSQENLIYSPYGEINGSLLDANIPHIRVCKKDCSADSQWPDNLKTGYPELQRLPFWVRSNFEKTLQAHRKNQGKAALPFRIDVVDLEWQINLQPNDYAANILAGGQDIGIHVLANPQAFIRGQGRIQNNLVQLGLKTFLEMGGLEVQLDRWRNVKGIGAGFRPRKLATDIGGLLHLVGSPNGMLQQAFGLGRNFGLSVPFAPQNWQYRGPDPACYLFHFNPQCQTSGPMEDILLTNFLPKEILNNFSIFENSTGFIKSLPPEFLLEDLILKILTAVERGKKKKKDPNKITAIGNLFSRLYLKPGSSVNISIKELRDLFIPGILDLGPSRGEVMIQIDKDQNLIIGSSDFEINLEAMDYPFPKKGKRGALRINSGIVWPGEEIQIESHGFIRPGIYLTRETFSDLIPHNNFNLPALKSSLPSDPITGNAKIEANLNLDLGLGEGLSLKGQLLLKGELLNTQKGLQLSPKIYLALKDINVRDGEGKDLVKDLNLVLDSDPLGINWFQAPFKKFFEKNANIQVSGTFKDGRQLEFQGSLGIPLNQSGAIDLENLIHKLDLVSLINYAEKDGSEFKTRFNLKSSPLPSGTGEKIYPFEASLDIAQKGKGQKKFEPLLGKGEIQFKLFDNPGNFYRADLKISANSLHLNKRGTTGLHFQGVEADLEVDKIEFSDELRTATFPKLKLNLNKNGSKKGGILGPISLEQAQDKPFKISWEPLADHWKVEGLDVGFGVQEILLSPTASKIFARGTRSLGMDGRLQVDFCLNTRGEKTKWNGEGMIQILGDPEGDIYPLDWNGYKFGPPIFRKTKWQWKKISGFSPYGNYPLGQGHLNTWLNLASFGSISKAYQEKGDSEYMGSHPFEFLWVMDYNNQPLSVTGFNARIEKYILDICLDTPTCRSDLLAQMEKQKGSDQ